MLCTVSLLACTLLGGSGSEQYTTASVTANECSYVLMAYGMVQQRQNVNRRFRFCSHTTMILHVFHFMPQLRQVYQYYSALGGNEGDDVFTLSLEQLWELCRDCGLFDKALGVPDVNRLLQQVRSLGRHFRWVLRATSCPQLTLR